MKSEIKILEETINKMKNVLQEEKHLHARLQKEIEVSFNNLNSSFVLTWVLNQQHPK